jgi:hypothetical protein
VAKCQAAGARKLMARVRVVRAVHMLKMPQHLP